MRKDYTLLYTDVVDSTAVNTRLGDAGMAPLWDEHDRRSRELLRQWRGREIDRSDGFLVLFDQPADAAAFCSHYHRMLASLPVPLRARAGLHVGPLTLRENAPEVVDLGAKPTEVVGIAKAMAARFMALAQGGQTLATPAACQALQASGAIGQAPSPWRCVSHGHWRMKGLDSVIEVFEIGDAHSAFVPPADSDKSQRMVLMGNAWVGARDVPHNLPGERDSFVGRHEELKTVAQLFTEGARLLTLSGPGGMGKTRMALRYAWSWLGDHPGGLWFCDLAAARGIDGLLHAVGQGLDVPLGTGAVVQLGRAIAGRGRCLVILDNFEQLRPHARDTLGHWLDAAPQARFIVTSREVLGLQGERTLALAPLSMDDAATLFHQRARAAHAGHDPAAEPEATHELMALLDGMPLAIELAAPRVRVMPTPELLARMGNRFRVLAAGSGRPDRQATLRAALAWSWDLLSPDERSVLAQLSVFEGGFAWPAVQAVVHLGLDGSTPGDDAPWIIDLLQSLVDKSLVTPRLGARFNLLRSVKDFAAEELAREGSFPGSGPDLAAAARRRHYAYYAALTEAQTTAGHCIELDNLVSACEHAADDDQADLAVGCLRRSWTALRMSGPFVFATQLAERMRSMQALQEEHRLWIDQVAGRAHLALGDQVLAREAALRTLSADIPPEDDEAWAAAHSLMGEVEMAAGDYQASAEHLERAMAHATRLGPSYWLRWVLNAQGALMQQQGRLAEARRHYLEALAIGFAEGNKQWQAALLNNLAGLHFSEGELEQARKTYEQALSLSSEVGSTRFEGSARCNLGVVLHELGQHQRASEELAQALEVAKSLGYARLVHVVHCNLGLVAEASNDLTRAAHHFGAARDAARACQEPRAEAQYNAYLAGTQCRMDLQAEASDTIDRARALLVEKPDPLAEGLLYCSLSEWHLRATREDEGLAAFAQARQVLANHGWHADTELGRRVRLTARRLGLEPA